jgi:septum formation protein
MSRHRLILASASPRRLALLEQIGVHVDAMLPASVDEAPQRFERPGVLAERLARAKAEAARAVAASDDNLKDAFILAADTVVAQGRRVLPKAESIEQAEACLSLLSGRAHRVYTAIALLPPDGKMRSRLVETRVRFKHLSAPERDSYLASGDWRDKAGGYAIQGIAGAFVIKLVGSYSAVVGLPLYETMNMLNGAGFVTHVNWLNPLDVS